MPTASVPPPLTDRKLADRLQRLFTGIQEVLILCQEDSPFAARDRLELLRTGRRFARVIYAYLPAGVEEEPIPRCHCGQPATVRRTIDGGATFTYLCPDHAAGEP
jgi:hypothetical protein